MRCSGIYDDQAYHCTFADMVLNHGLEICHLEALNCVVALRLWAEQLTGRLMNLHYNSPTAVAIMRAGWGRDTFLQARTRVAWLILAVHGITFVVKHITCEKLAYTADALSRCHTSGKFHTIGRRAVVNMQQYSHHTIAGRQLCIIKVLVVCSHLLYHLLHD